MFENKPVTPLQTNPAPTPATPPTPENKPANATAQTAAAPDIHTMPMQYYLGENTKSASAAMAAGKPAASGGNKPVFLIVGVVMSLAVLGIAGWLIYRQFETPAPIATVPTLSPSPIVIPETPSESVVVQLPGSGVATLSEEVATVSSQPNSPEPFNPDKLQKIALNLVLKTDTDRDGLTDDEEILMGLNPLLIDTDKDGYLDGDEVKNFYSPLAVGKVTIDKMRFAGQYANDKYGYKIIYPAAWILAPLEVADPSEVMITSTKDEFVNILVEQKSAGQSIDEWYRAMAPTASATPLRKYTTFNKLEAYESPDGFTTYIAHGNEVIIINYNIGLKTESSYPEIYQLIVNSLKFAEEVNSPPTP